MANDQNLKPFKKGPDKRRNLKGRPPQPKNFAEFRQVVIDFLNEPKGRNKTRLLVMLEKMANTKERKTLLEYAAGKVPQSLDLNVKRIINVDLSDDNSDED